MNSTTTYIMACNRYLSTRTNYQFIAFVKAVSHQLINNSLKKRITKNAGKLAASTDMCLSL